MLYDFSLLFNLLYFYIILVVSGIYIFLYTWRKLSISLLSYICFLINASFFCLFTFGIFKLYHGFPYPIYIENISLFAYYRYLTFLIITIIGICMYVITRNIKVMAFFMEQVSFPYLKEEMYKLLHTWNDFVFGEVCSNIIDNLYKSFRYRLIFILFHLCLTSLIPLAQVYFLFSFVFFHGDLRWNLYLLPISFISWIFRFFEYYFKTFLIGSVNSLKELVTVTLVNPLSAKEEQSIYLKRDASELNFTLTEEGSKTLTISDLNWLVPLWCSTIDVEARFKQYMSRYYLIVYFVSILRLICWCGIISLSDYSDYFLTFSLFAGLTIVSRGYAKEAFRIRRAAQKALESQTGGAYKRGHTATTDLAKEKNGLIPFISGNTHGRGSQKNPSSEIHDSKDLAGDNKPQRATFPKNPVMFDKSHLGDPVPGSKEYFDQPEVKANFDKYLPKKTDNNSDN